MLDNDKVPPPISRGNQLTTENVSFFVNANFLCNAYIHIQLRNLPHYPPTHNCGITHRPLPQHYFRQPVLPSYGSAESDTSSQTPRTRFFADDLLKLSLRHERAPSIAFQDEMKGDFASHEQPHPIDHRITPKTWLTWWRRKTGTTHLVERHQQAGY